MFFKHLILLILHLCHFAHHPSPESFYAEYVNHHINRCHEEEIIERIIKGKGESK